MSNEELAVAIRAGERDKLMELWGQVRRLVHDMAYKRLRATNGAGGVTLDDLMQAGFLGFLEAVRAYDPSAGFRFTSYLTYPVKSAFSEAEGRRSEKQKRDPIFSAVSIDAPLDEGEGEPLTLADVIPDPQATEALEVLEYGIPFTEPWRACQRARKRKSGGGTGSTKPRRKSRRLPAYRRRRYASWRRQPCGRCVTPGYQGD